MPDLVQFLQQQKDALQSPESAKKHEMWLAALRALMNQIRTWLVKVESQMLIKVDPDQITITEEITGVYTAPALTLTVLSTGKKVRIIPIGRTIIGADGRVDLKSAKGIYMLLYLADRGEWVHGTGTRPDDFPVLNEDLFTDLLTRALG